MDTSYVLSFLAHFSKAQIQSVALRQKIEFYTEYCCLLKICEKGHIQGQKRKINYAKRKYANGFVSRWKIEFSSDKFSKRAKDRGCFKKTVLIN